MTLYLQARRLDPRVRPGRWVTWAVGTILAVQALLSAFIIRNLLA